MKSNYSLLLIATIILFAACNSGYKIPEYEDDETYEQQKSDTIFIVDTVFVGKENIDIENDNISEASLAESEYSPIELYVEPGESFGETLQRYTPQLDDVSNNQHLGGSKLIAEMSADVAGSSHSRSDEGGMIKILSLGRLKLKIPDDPNTISGLMRQGIISVDRCVIRSKHSSVGDFEVIMYISNKIGEVVVVKIPQGQMIEAQRENVQNIVVSASEQTEMRPFSSAFISVPARCASRKRSDPSGSEARITPYVLTAPKSAYGTKYSLWDYIEEPAAYRMVFYAWGRGAEINGHTSTFGHAFVAIPHIGVKGFGPTESFYGSQGKVLSENDDVRYAQDSCVVYISASQLNKVKRMYNKLYNNPKTYNLGIYDCTSFAMDMADAAGVYYGKRWHIQWPTDFIRQLNKYN